MLGWISLSVFLTMTAVVIVVYVFMQRDDRLVASRVRRLGDPVVAAPGGAWSDLLEWLRSLTAQLGGGPERQAHLRRRFGNAGIYSPQAVAIYLAVRLVLTLAGALLSLGAVLLHLVPPLWMLPSVLIATGLGLLVPGLWLDSRVRAWQGTLRRGLPDAMDMLVLCLEGGASFTAAFQYMVTELKLAHPDLAGELEIVQHEMSFGKTAGEAMENLAHRTDLEDLRTLASVLLQNERYGVSIAKALRIHADAMRQQRQQRAEEKAQQAAVQVLFPTLLCIFPAIFVVILGPAAFRIMAVLSKMQ